MVPSHAANVPDSKPSLKTAVEAEAYVNWSAALVALVWPPTVTLTSTVPVPDGLVALQVVVLAQVTAVPAAAPKPTVVVPAVVLKPVPVIVTAVPPAAGPLVGLIPVTTGAGGRGAGG